MQRIRTSRILFPAAVGWSATRGPALVVRSSGTTGFSSLGVRSFVRSVACGSDLSGQQSEFRDIWQTALAAMIPDAASTSRSECLLLRGLLRRCFDSVRVLLAGRDQCPQFFTACGLAVCATVGQSKRRPPNDGAREAKQDDDGKFDGLPDRSHYCPAIFLQLKERRTAKKTCCSFYCGTGFIVILRGWSLSVSSTRRCELYRIIVLVDNVHVLF